MSAQEKEQSVIWVPKLAQRLLHFGYDASTAGICVLQIELMLQMLHIAPYLTGDAAVYENPELYFDHNRNQFRRIRTTFKWSFTPDLATPISKKKEEAIKTIGL
jgi:aconitate hydratase